MFYKLDFCEVCNLSKKKCICNKVKCECCQKSFSNKSNLKRLNLKEAKKVINNFSDQFYNLYMEFDLSMTLKTHIIIHHYMYFFQKTKKTMRLTNGEFHESCHSTLRQSEERSNFKVKRKIGTPMHQYKSWQSLVFYNSKRAGHITPLRLKRKSSPHSPSVRSSPFSKQFLSRYPAVSLQHKILTKKYK